VGLFDKLIKRFQPPTMEDPYFGKLVYMHVNQDPAKSYWEAEFLFPPTGTTVFAGLQGGKEGPFPEARDFYLELPDRFEWIMSTVLPSLNQVFLEWQGRPISINPWEDVILAGFGVEDPTKQPREWDISFETTTEKWLGIIIPFIGDEPQTPVVDT